MKVTYRGCEIECYREESCLYYSIFDNGFEVDSGFSYSEDTVREHIKSLKKTVDDYIAHPENYKDDEDDEVYSESEDDNTLYQITPKGIAIVSMLRCGLIDNIDDPRVEGFWMLFEDGMRKGGYIVEENEDDNQGKGTEN